MEYTTLSNGVQMPLLGYGVYRMSPDECHQGVSQAIASGYRLIDTAAVYLNESAVGQAIRESAIPRASLFLTSKVWIQDMGYDATLRAFDRTLARLDTDYLDLYLLHMPFGDVFGAWRALQEIYRSGRARAIGVCNFSTARLADLMSHFDVRPMVNQVETHLFNQQKCMLRFCHRYEIQLEAWSPFAEGLNNYFGNPVLCEIGERHGRTPAQVALRWLTQRGIVVIPKTVRPLRMIENFRSLSFRLDDEEMATLSMQDEQRPLVGDFEDPDFVADLCSRKYDL